MLGGSDTACVTGMSARDQTARGNMKPERRDRSQYVQFEQMTTRWRDNDAYGHMNNVVFYEYVDTCVNAWLIRHGLLDPATADVIGLVVHTSCDFHDSVGFPDRLETGLAVARVGTSSVQYEVGIFKDGASQSAADARLTHVYVDRVDRRPVPLSGEMRSALQALIIAE